MLSPLVMLCVLIVGVMIGSIGIGGVLQVPVLRVLGEIPIHSVIPACMLAYLLPGIVGAFVYHRHGSLHWPAATRVCAGALPGAFLGAWLLPSAPAALLEVLVGLLILASGVDALTRKQRGETGGLGNPGYIGVGFITGAISALTGAGGPLTLVPILVWYRVPVRVVVGLGQVIQIPISLMATAGNLRTGMVDLHLALWLTLILSAGVLIGGWLAHRLPEQRLRRGVAVLLVLVGAGLLIRLLFFV
jgi:uncharacterized membrane protein YfcA